MKKISLFLLSILTVLSVMIPIGGIAAAEQSDTAYAFPAEYNEKLDSRYVKLDIDKLDACLYALLNYNGEVEYRLVVEQTHEDHTDIGLMPVTLQHAVVHDEDQPEILITVHPDKGFIEDEWFLTSFSKQLKKQAKKGKLTVETEFGDIVFDLDNMQKKAKKDPHKGKTPTEKPSENPTSSPVNTPAGTNAPDATNKPTTAPATQPPQNPTATPNPTNSPESGEKHSCGWCDASFSSESALNSHIASTHPACPYCGSRYYNQSVLNTHVANEHSTTPTPAPTATPKPTDTPAPTPSGHWERRWVVDVPRQTHSEWVCNCGARFTSESAHDAHCKAHALAGENTRYWVETIVDQEEQGHWEDVWVPDP